MPLPPGTLLYAFNQSDGFARAIVALLLLLSVFAWSIMIEKGITIRRARRGSKKFLRAFAQAPAPLELALRLDQFKGPLARVYEAGLDEVMDILGVTPHQAEECCRRRALPRPLTPPEIDKVRNTLERTVATHIMKMEERLGLLATAVTVSPFLGLLGTVWGVMMAFSGMAVAGRPDIGAMAPGVSGALLTTVVGLVVAIPAVVGYNLLANAVRQTTVEMDNFVEDYLALFKMQTDVDGG